VCAGVALNPVAQSLREYRMPSLILTALSFVFLGVAVGIFVWQGWDGISRPKGSDGMTSTSYCGGHPLRRQ
jgi:predicted PurR-regulated permease PerM